MSKLLADEIEAGSDVMGFDAIRGIQAGQEFYVAMCPMRIIPKLFRFNEKEIPPELRAQRILRESRVPEIANYMVSNPDNYVFSSLTASVDGKMKFSPAPSAGEHGKIGRLYISLHSKILINDGQHRRAAIEEALEIKPDLGDEFISVVFFSDKGLKRSQQMFSDLNKYAVKPTKSLNILYDHRNDFSQFIVDLPKKLDIFRNRVELEKTTISNRSLKFVTLNGISDATKELLGISSKASKITVEQQKLAVEFWDEVSKNIPEWHLLIEKKVTPYELRTEFVHSHTNLLNALGITGNVLVREFPTAWKQKLKKLQTIDWSRSSSIWEGKLILEGTMLKTRSGINRAANIIIKECLGKLPSDRKQYEGLDAYRN